MYINQTPNRCPTFSSLVLHAIERSLDEEDARIMDDSSSAAPAAAAARNPMTSDDFELVRRDLLTFVRCIAAERRKPIPGEEEEDEEEEEEREKKMMTATKKKTGTSHPQSSSGGRLIVAASPLGYGCYVRKPIKPRSSEQQQTTATTIMPGEAKGLNRQRISRSTQITSSVIEGDGRGGGDPQSPLRKSRWENDPHADVDAED